MAPPSTPDRPSHVVLAEDDPVNQEACARVLRKRGYRVSTAATGHEVLAVIAREPVDLVLMDCQMPEMDGFAATASIRAREQTATGQPRLPIIALTAHAMAGDRERCLAKGMDGYATKPINRQVLFAEIDRFLSPPKPASAAAPPAPPSASVAPPLPPVHTQAAPDPLDRAALADNFGDDHELLHDLLALFDQNTPNLLTQLDAAVRAHQAKDIEQVAHRLAGALSNLCAMTAAHAAKALEATGRAGDLTSAQAQLDDLAAKTAAARAALGQFLGRGDDPAFTHGQPGTALRGLDRDDAIVHDLLSALGTLLFIRTTPDTFMPVGGQPDWLHGCKVPAPCDRAMLTTLFPLLESFLPEAEPIWDAGGPAGGVPGRRRSDPWTQPHPAGDENPELCLEATAIHTGRRALLVVMSATAATAQRQTLLQAARNAALRHEDELAVQRRAQSELMRARKLAEEASGLKSRFLANTSHELRTPLNAILLYSELVKEDLVEAGLAQHAADLDKIHAAGSHLLALINNVLDLSKIESGRMDVFLESFDARKLVQDVVDTVKPVVEKNGNRFEITLDPAVGEMHSDLTKVRQGLINLLSNASKFTKQGTVTLAAARSTDAQGQAWIELQVRDTGIGMTPDQVGRLFQPFTQAEASTSKTYGGTGLGLSIAREFARLLGGDIAVMSSPGKGSTFTLRVPERSAAPPA